MNRYVVHFLTFAFCVSVQICAAQVAVELYSVKVRNVTERCYKPANLISLLKSTDDFPEVELEVEGAVVNNNDSTLIFEVDSLMICYYTNREGKARWSPMHDDSRMKGGCTVYNAYYALRAHQSYSIHFFIRYPRYYFMDISPLYYMSNLIPTIRLELTLPGQKPILSDEVKHVWVNGVHVDNPWYKCDNCGSTYQLVNNEVLKEFLLENPELFGNIFNEAFLINEFQCSMALARRTYASLLW